MDIQYLLWLQELRGATVVAAFGGYWGNFIARMVMVFFAICIWPVLIHKECGKQK